MYLLGPSLAAALLAILFEHPVGAFNRVSHDWAIRACADLGPTLAGWGKTIAAFWNFDGSRVWDKSGLSRPSG